MRMSDGTAPEKEVAALLQQARILRLMGYFDWAQRSYQDARARAEAAVDTHAVLLSRIGEAIVLRQKGNLPASERALRKVLKDAERLGDRDAQARAHHDLGGAILLMDRTTEAIEHIFAAFELYAHWDDKLRALSDLGEALRREGRYQAAKNAFLSVVQRAKSAQIRSRSMISLMELAAFSGDPLEFARWRTEIETLEEQLPAEHLADFYLQLGRGYHRFGKRQKAIAALTRASEIAETYQLNDYVALAKDAAQQLTAGPAALREEPGTRAAAEPESRLRRIEQALSELVAA
jgi:tetratricopeptide (TPR) repeat protein